MSRLIEHLETRRLLHGPLSVAINFAPLNAPRAPGLLTDYGVPYGVRRGGLTYGWDTDVQANSVDRNLTKIQKNDTFINMQNVVGSNTADHTWAMAVENGTYDVYIVAGDPGDFGHRVAITAEGEVAVTGVTKPNKRYIEGLTHVTVTDNKLTIGNAAWSDGTGNRICYIGVVSTEDTPDDTLTIDTPQNSVTEGSGKGIIRITRDGDDIDKTVTIPLSIGGTATNGVDYGRFATSLTMAANVTSIDLPVRAIADSLDEGDETVTLTLGTVAGYTNVESSATVTIRNAGGSTPTTPAPTNIAWSTKASRPLAASEILGAAVGHKLYTFGGFVDSTYHPTREAYSYDVTSNTWHELAELPVGLTHAGVATDDTRYIYLAGGYPGNGKNGQQTFSTAAVYRYDTQSDTYSTLKSLPQARGAGTLAYLNNKLYFFAGENSSRQDVTTVWALDLADQDDGWVSKAAVPSPRNHVAAVPLGGKIYIIGGQTGNDAGTVTQAPTYRYDPAANTWVTLASIPTARSHMADASFVYDNKIVVLGGQSGYNSPIASDVLYDPATNKWTTLNSLPDARYSGAAAFIGGKFVYAAGIKSNFAATTYVGTLT